MRNGGGMWAGPSNGRASDLIALTADSKDWGDGVKLAYVREARHAACQFAGTKILSWAMNLTWLESAQARGFDEVILLNERGEVAECTSANLFVANGSQVWTPPLEFRLPARRLRGEVMLGEDPRSRNPGGRKSAAARRSGSRRRSVHHLHHARPPARLSDRRQEGRPHGPHAAGAGPRLLGICEELRGSPQAGCRVDHFSTTRSVSPKPYPRMTGIEPNGFIGTSKRTRSDGLLEICTRKRPSGVATSCCSSERRNRHAACGCRNVAIHRGRAASAQV